MTDRREATLINLSQVRERIEAEKAERRRNNRYRRIGCVVALIFLASFWSPIIAWVATLLGE